MTSSQDNIEFYVRPAVARKAVLVYGSLAVLCFGFVIVAVAFAEQFAGARVVALVTGVVGAAAFGYLALVSLRRWISKEPFLVLSPQGMLDNGSGTSSGAGWIEWSEIADVRLSKYHNLPCVEVVPKDREAFLRRFGWLERFNRSARLGYPAVALRGPLLSVEPADLAEQMREYWLRATDT